MSVALDCAGTIKGVESPAALKQEAPPALPDDILSRALSFSVSGRFGPCILCMSRMEQIILRSMERV